MFPFKPQSVQVMCYATKDSWYTDTHTPPFQIKFSATSKVNQDDVETSHGSRGDKTGKLVTASLASDLELQTEWWEGARQQGFPTPTDTTHPFL